MNDYVASVCDGFGMMGKITWQELCPTQTHFARMD